MRTLTKRIRRLETDVSRTDGMESLAAIMAAAGQSVDRKWEYFTQTGGRTDYPFSDPPPVPPRFRETIAALAEEVDRKLARAFEAREGKAL